MRTLGALIIVLAVGLSTVEASGATGRTELRIAYREDGSRPRSQVVWTLRCDPAGGTHPSRAKACRSLAQVGWPAFRPVPPNTACTEIYGGPQTAVISGVVDGRHVWTRLRRDNGCEISRWDRLLFLIPVKPR
jgi:subtilisin inhibitor-like